jgi:superfamily II DNA or RNA helicase
MNEKFIELLNELYADGYYEVANALIDESPVNRTRIEKLIFEGNHKLSHGDMLTHLIEDLKKESPAMAAKAKNALKLKKQKGYKTLELNINKYNKKFKDLLNGPWKKITGKGGLSAPFVSIKTRSQNILEISHMADEFSLIIEWTNKVEYIRSASNEKRYGKRCRVLRIPIHMTRRSEITALEPYLFELISGSYFQPFISSHQSTVKQICALLHDGKLIKNRPGQNQFVQLLNKFYPDEDFKKQMQSLLYVAPTGAGKTRILGLAATEHIKRFKREYKKKTRRPIKNITMLVTQDPRLVDQLARDIGPQIANEFHEGEFRLIQWGGTMTENLKFKDFMNNFLDDNVPTIIFTSTQSLGMRVKGVNLRKLLERVSTVAIDEAHHTHQPAFQKLLRAANKQAEIDRRRKHPLPLTTFGVTATPNQKDKTSSQVFDQAFWALIDNLDEFVEEVKDSSREHHTDWFKVPVQLTMAKHAGEITAQLDPDFVSASEVKPGLKSIFKVVKTRYGGHVDYVNNRHMGSVWKYLKKRISDQGKGVIDCYPRDCVRIANSLSRTSGKNFVALDSELSTRERNKILNCFRNQTPYKGRDIYALVGTIGEGFDFPFIGWYVSMKRFVKPWEVYQGPGRAFRLSLGKNVPEVIFFGQQIDEDKLVA